MTRAIVLGGSRGIGKAISNSLKSIEIDVFATSKNDIDTSDLNSIRKFLKKNTETDICFENNLIDKIQCKIHRLVSIGNIPYNTTYEHRDNYDVVYP